MKAGDTSKLPKSLPPRGIKREQAAEYIGVGTTKFDEMVADGRMPKPKKIDGCVVWDVRLLDAYWDDLPDENGVGSSEWKARL